MTALGDAWLAMWDAIHTLVESVSDFDVVQKGLKFPMDNYPCAMVGAGIITPVQFNTVGTLFTLTLPILVFAKDDNITTGMVEAIGLAGEVYALFAVERWEGDPLDLSYVENIEVFLYANGPNIPLGYERQGVELTVVVRFYLDAN